MENSTSSSQVITDGKFFNWRTFEPSMLPDGMNSSLALELVTFRDKLDEMLAGHEGDFVVIKGDKIIGYHAERDDAVHEVFEKFGTHSALVKKVMELEPLLSLGSIG
jgi:hypothetical protein